MERLIERWFPVRELSDDAKFEKSAIPKKYPLVALHLWFARRPQGVARATTLAALATPDFSPKKFLSLIKGRPQRSVRRYKRVPLFRTNVKRRIIEEVFMKAYKELPIVLDPMAGGGSIPLESLRLGARTIAVELNPVAYMVLRATLEFPAKYGRGLYEDVKEYSNMLTSKLRQTAGKYYPYHKGRKVKNYVLAKVVTCPSCKQPVLLGKFTLVEDRYALPLSSKKGKIYLLTSDGTRFKVSERLKSESSKKGGKRIVPHLPINTSCKYRLLKRELVKQMSIRGLSHKLIAIHLGGNKFDIPSDVDIKAFETAEKDLRDELTNPLFTKFVPNDLITPDSITDDLREHGITRWEQAYNPRQLLVNATLARSVYDIGQELSKTNGVEYALAVTTYLAFMVDKVVDYNSIITRWDHSTPAVEHTFYHPVMGFKFTYDYGEGNIPRNIEWARNDVLRTLDWVVEDVEGLGDRVSVQLGNALNLSRLLNQTGIKKVHLVNVDPPYYQNLMYADLSEFFWVWLKRMIGDLLVEEWAQKMLKKGVTTNSTDALRRAKSRLARFEPKFTKGSEVVGTKERFEPLMETFLKEAKRVLADDGLLVVWFTHSKLESWEALVKALDAAGFIVSEAWSVWTEMRKRTTARGKSALMSTVLLACRKRTGEAIIPTPREMLRSRIVETLLTRLPELEQYDITGPDLFIAAIGLALKGSMEYIRAEEALSVAYEAVGDALVRYLFGERAGALDPPTRGYVALMYVTKGIKGRKLTFDEVNKIAKGLRASMPDLESYDVVLRERGKKGGVYAVCSSTLARDSRGNIQLSLEDPRLAERIKSRIVRAKASLVDVSRFILMKVSLEGHSAIATLGQLMKYGYTINTFRDAVKLLRIMDKCSDKGELEYRGKFIIGLVEDAIKKIGA